MAKIILNAQDYVNEFELNMDDLILIEKTLKREAVKKWNHSCKRTNPKYKKLNDKLENQADILMYVGNCFRLMQEYEKNS